MLRAHAVRYLFRASECRTQRMLGGVSREEPALGYAQTAGVSAHVTNRSPDLSQRPSGPVRQLKGFKRIALQPGETKTLRFPIGKEELKYWNPQTKEWVEEPSDFDVWAGEDSTDGLHGDLKVTE